MTDHGSTLREFARDPRTFIWTIIVGGILAAWGEALDSIAEAFGAVSASLERSFLVPLLVAGAAILDAILGAVGAMHGSFQSAAMATGVAGPIAFGLATGFTVAILLTLMSLTLTALDQLSVGIPLGALPVVGRWFR